MSPLLWIIVAVSLAILEIFTAGFFIIFFAAGAAITAVSALFITNVTAQLTIFLISSVIMVWFARPIVKKAFNISDLPTKPSNVETLVGEEILVLEDVSRYSGRVKVLHTGEIWTAYLDKSEEEDSTLPAGAEGVVASVDGAKLVIKPRQAAQTASS